MASTALADDSRVTSPTVTGIGRALRGAWRWIGRTGAWLPVVVIAAIALPLLLTDRTFGPDWTLHLWLLWRQELNLEETHLPGLFASAESVTPIPMGVFFPIFAFTGATLYTIGGLLAIALGDRPVAAYVLLWVATFALAYGGLTWLAHQVGLRGLRAQVPGALYVTGAYYITNAYGRGDLGELVGLSVLPFFVAALWAVLTSERVRVRDAAALVAATILFTGSHNITLLWGTVFLVLLAVVALVAFRPAPTKAIGARMLLVVGLGILATAVNAWSLVPNLAFGLDSFVAKESAALHPTNGGLATARYLLDPFRSTPGGMGREHAVTLPWLALVWAAVAVGVAWRSVVERWLKVMTVGSAVLIAGFLLFAVSPRVWHWLPGLFANTQFTWRLHGYVLLAAVLVVMFALRMTQSIPSGVTRRVLHGALGVITVFSIAMAVVQVERIESRMIVPGYNVPYEGTRGDIVSSRDELPISYYGSSMARDMKPRVVVADPDRVLRIAPEHVVGSTFRGVVLPPEGFAPFHTNIATSERLLDVDGIDVLGRDADGFLVARRTRDQGATGPVELSITAASSGPIVAGRVITVLALFGLVALFVMLALRNLRSRASGRRPPSARHDDSTASTARTLPGTPRR